MGGAITVGEKVIWREIARNQESEVFPKMSKMFVYLFHEFFVKIKV